MALTWNDIFTTGSLIHFSRHAWEGRTKLTDGDIGIGSTVTNTEEGQVTEEKIVNRTIKLARAKRFKALNDLRSAFKEEIESKSLNFPVLESVRYVPDTQVAALRENLERINREYTAAVDAFVSKFDEIKAEGLEDVRKMLFKEGFCLTAEHAEGAFVRVQAEYPDPADVQKKFGLEFDFFTIQMPVSAEAAAAAKEAAPQVKGVIESMVTQLRSELSDKLSNLIRMTGDEKVRMNSITSALDLLSKVDSLNFLGDQTLAEQTNLLRSLLQNAKDSKDRDQEVNFGELMNGLTKAQTAISSDLQEAVASAERNLLGLGKRHIG